MKLLAGRFAVRGSLGRGGQGSVVRATDTASGLDVALKLRPVGPGIHRDDVLDEARVLLRIPPHPNIAMVRADLFDGDTHILVMDFVDGPSLASLLRAAGGAGLPAPRVVGWLQDVGRALDHLHHLLPPVVHGDVKPANVVIRRDSSGEEVAVLVDFGLAASVDARLRGHATAGFAAPETARGGAGPAADLYSLAATAYALLTGRAPSPGELPALPRATQRVFADGLALRSESRPDSAEAFVAALATSLGVAAPADPPAAPSRRLRLRVLAAVSAVTIVLVVAVAWSLRDSGSSAGRRRAVADSATTTLPAEASTTVVPVSVAGPATTTVAALGPVVSEPTVAIFGRFLVVESSGAVVTYQLRNGSVAREGATASPANNWTSAARIRPNKVLLYRQGDGFNKVTTLADGGNASFGRSEDAQAGWSHVTGLEDGLVFFYRSSDGYAATIRFGDNDHVRDGNSYLDWRVVNAGYDRVAYAGANRVLLYNSRNGTTLMAAVGATGAMSTLASPRLGPGWTDLAATGNGYMLGLDAQGTASVLRSSAGGVDQIATLALPDGTWSNSARYRDGVVVANRATGAALIVRLASDGRHASTTSFTLTPGAVLGPLD